MKKKRNCVKTLRLQHALNQRTNLYPFLIKNLIKTVVIIALIVVGIIYLNKILDLEKILKQYVQTGSRPFVFGLFLFSESFLSWLPPEIFMAWAQQFEYEYLYITILAAISYIGGINAYYIGIWIQHFPRIKKWITVKNAKIFTMIRKWGGFLIVFAAIFPLPYALTCTVAGMVDYPLKRLLLYGLTRFLRFYVYAFAVFKALENIVN